MLKRPSVAGRGAMAQVDLVITRCLDTPAGKVGHCGKPAAVILRYGIRAKKTFSISNRQAATKWRRRLVAAEGRYPDQLSQD